MYGLLAIAVGALTAVQSRLNGQLSKDLHNGIAAALVSFGTGFIVLIFITLFMEKERKALVALFSAVKHGRLKRWEIVGGTIGALFVSVQSATVPVIGVAIFSICTIAGQTAASLLVDKFGISPRGKQPITAPRVFAGVMTLVAVTVAVYPDLSNSTFQILPVVLGVAVGAIAAYQAAINGRVNEVIKRPLGTAWLNFLMGFSLLIFILAGNLVLGGHIDKFPTNPMAYMGGTIGVIFISVSAFVVKHMGILDVILFSTSGVLTGAILLDWLAPANGASLDGYLIAGTLLTLVSIGISQVFTKRALAKATN